MRRWMGSEWIQTFLRCTWLLLFCLLFARFYFYCIFILWYKKRRTKSIVSLWPLLLLVSIKSSESSMPFDGFRISLLIWRAFRTACFEFNFFTREGQRIAYNYWWSVLVIAGSEPNTCPHKRYEWWVLSIWLLVSREETTCINSSIAFSLFEQNIRPL